MSKAPLKAVENTPRRPYSLSEEGFEYLTQAQSALLLLGSLSAEQDSMSAALPADDLANTLLMLSRQLKRVMTDCCGGAV